MNVRFHFHELSHLRHSSDPLIFTGILQPSTASIYKEKYSRIISEELQVIHYVFTTWKLDLPTEVSPFISAIFYSLFVAIAMRRKRLTNFSVQASSQRRLPSLYRLVKKRKLCRTQSSTGSGSKFTQFCSEQGNYRIYFFHRPNIFSVKINKAEEQKYYQITKR